MFQSGSSAVAINFNNFQLLLELLLVLAAKIAKKLELRKVEIDYCLTPFTCASSCASQHGFSYRI